MFEEKKKRKPFLERRLENWNEFIRELHLENNNSKITRWKIFTRFLNKLLIIVFASFFTTSAFYFFLNTNGIYNSGLNGLVQIFSRLIVGNFSGFDWNNYYSVYYGIILFLNILFVVGLRIFYKTSRLEVISTGIFHAIFQIFWTKLFDYFNLQKLFFEKFGLNNITGTKFYSTLPYYLIVSITASFIHAYGNSLLLQVQSTLGGFDTFFSHFSFFKKKDNFRNKKKAFINTSRFVSIFTVFLITVLNFGLIDNNINIRKKQFFSDLDSVKKKTDFDYLDNSDLINMWKSDMEELTYFLENNDYSSYQKTVRKWNDITKFFSSKVRTDFLIFNPVFLDYYINFDDKKSLEKIETNIDEIIKKIANPKLSPDFHFYQAVIFELDAMKTNLKKDENRNIFFRYFNYLLNDEKFWASIFYIFVSSFLLSKIFPREKLINLQVYCNDADNLESVLRLLSDFSPIYCEQIFLKNSEFREKVYVVSCYISKWNYYLFSSYLSELGEVYTSDSD